MINSITGKLFKTPTINEKLNIEGKTAIDFTVVENRKRGENKKVSTFYNLTLITSSERQRDMILGLGAGTVLVFAGIRANYMTGGDRDSAEVKNNFYADVQSFEIVPGTDNSGGGGGGGEGGQRQSNSGGSNNYSSGGSRAPQQSANNAPAPRRAPARPQLPNAPVGEKDPFDDGSEEGSPFDN